MKINGIITAMVTPLNKQGIDESACRLLVHHLIEQGINGLFILGTNGEFYTLSKQEKIQLAKIIVEETNGRIPVFAGAGGISTEEVIELSQAFRQVGVTAVSVITPFLIHLSEEEIIAHYTKIAQETTLPILLYNIPQNTHLPITERVFKELVTIQSIIGIKDSSGDMENLEMYIRYGKARKDFSVLVGSDSKILEALTRGADGAVAATSNVLPVTDVGIYRAFKKKEMEKAEKLQKSIEPFRKLLKYSSVPSVLKKSCERIGYPVGPPRFPILPVSEQYQKEIKETLLRYQKIEGFEINQ